MMSVIFFSKKQRIAIASNRQARLIHDVYTHVKSTELIVKIDELSILGD